MKEKTFRKLRKEFKRFPNIGLVRIIELDQIGYFDSKSFEIYWKTRLSNFNISLEPHNISNNPISNELYTSEDSINYSYSIDEDKYGTIKVEFARARPLVTQARGMKIVSYDIDSLQEKIIKKIYSSEITWGKKWIIVAEVFRANSYTLLINNSKNSKITLKAGIPINYNYFNIVDPELELNITHSPRKAYQYIGEGNVTPFLWFISLIMNGIYVPMVEFYKNRGIYYDY